MRRAGAALAAALGALALYAGVGLFLVYPAWLDGAHAVVGDWRHPDMISNHWLYRWVAGRVLAGDWAGLLHNDRYYFPVGDAPWLAGNGSDAVPYALVAALLDWPGSVTAWCVLTVAANGLAGFLLARSRGARAGGALLGGLALALFPYVAHEMMGMRSSQAPLYWLAGFVAAWMALLDAEDGPPGRRRRLAVAAGLLFAANALVYWYSGWWAALLAAALLAFRRAWRGPALAAVIGAAPTLPVLALFLSRWHEIPGTEEDRFPNPLAVEASLPVTFPFWNGSVERAEVVVPLVVVGLAALGLAGLRRAPWARGLALGALLCWSLALGPDLLLPDGTDTGLPGPFRLVYAAAAPLRRFWWPYRHVAPMLVALVPLAAAGADRLAARAGRRAPLVAAALLALVPADLALRGGRTAVPVSWWEPPPAYERIARLPGDVILELPIAPEVATAQQRLSYQWVHGKTLVGGHAMWVDRVRPRAWDEWVAANSFLARIQEYERGELFGPFAFRPEDVVALREQGVRLLVVNAEYFPGPLYGLVPAYERIFTELFGEPVFRFRDQLRAWDLERYTFVGAVDAPPFRLPEGARAGAGGRMAEVGHSRSLGWRTVARLFPPVIPPAEVEPGSSPAAPAGDGWVPAQGVAPPQIRPVDEPQRPPAPGEERPR